jgi:hypothetical protein
MAECLARSDSICSSAKQANNPEVIASAAASLWAMGFNAGHAKRPVLGAAVLAAQAAAGADAAAGHAQRCRSRAIRAKERGARHVNPCCVVCKPACVDIVADVLNLRQLTSSVPCIGGCRTQRQCPQETRVTAMCTAALQAQMMQAAAQGRVAQAARAQQKAAAAGAAEAAAKLSAKQPVPSGLSGALCCFGSA